MRKIILVLHNIRSIHNVGSIFRTADAVGVEKIYLCGITPSPLDRFGKFRRDFVKAALGAEKTVAWDNSARSPRAIQNLLERLRRKEYKIFAVEQDRSAVPYYSLNERSSKKRVRRGMNIALIFGNEVR